jgi:hypothetical protein
MRRFVPLLLLAACVAVGDDADDYDATLVDDDTTAADDDATVDPESLYGEVPDEAVPLPEFAALNRDGGARSREDLLGHPTVMWFYPAAFTFV